LKEEMEMANNRKNYGAARSRDRMRRYGSEGSRGQPGIFATLTRPMPEPIEERQSKAEMRAEADAAIAEFKGQIQRLPTMHELRCPCGHRAKVSAPAGARPRFRCSKCGTRC
jgi:hypothetical protein